MDFTKKKKSKIEKIENDLTEVFNEHISKSKEHNNEILFCSSCGNQIGKTDNFCGHCRHKLNTEHISEHKAEVEDTLKSIFNNSDEDNEKEYSKSEPVFKNLKKNILLLLFILLIVGWVFIFFFLLIFHYGHSSGFMQGLDTRLSNSQLLNMCSSYPYAVSNVDFVNCSLIKIWNIFGAVVLSVLLVILYFLFKKIKKHNKK